MKRSSGILVTAVLLTAIASCKDEKQPADEWIAGSGNGTNRDTTVQGSSYRYYGGMWYPIMLGGMINPGRYNGASANDISRPGYRPSVRTGGFGRRSAGS